MDSISHEEVLRRLYRISTEHDQGFPYQVRAMLEVGYQSLGQEIGILSRIQGDRFVLEYLRAPAVKNLSEGQELALDLTLAGASLAAGGPVSISDLERSDFRNHPARRRWGINAYLGTPVMVDDDIYGTLSFSSLQSCSAGFSLHDKEMLELMALWLGVEIHRAGMEERVLQSERNFKLGMEASPAAMIMVEGDGSITYANRSCLELFGYALEDLQGRSIETLVPEQDRKLHPAHRERFAREGGSRLMGQGRVMQGCHRDGRLIPVEVSLNSLHNPQGALILCTILDMTDRLRVEDKLNGQNKLLEKANKDLASQAMTDDLTGLLNRRAFDSHLEALLRLARRQGTALSLMFADMDHFKVLNDTAGHQAGDEALKTVSGLLRDAARRSDIVARYGGEEFVLVLPETGPTGALDLAERIRGQVAALADLALPVTISIGVATLSDCRQEEDVALLAERLIKEADQALYAAKNAGRNRVLHSGDL